MTKEDREAQKQLAEAMTNLAVAIKRFQDPVWIQKTFADAVRQMIDIPLIAPTIAQALPPGVTLEAMTVRLSDEQKEELSQKVYEALSPQLKEFNQFLKVSLAEMPPHRLKELAGRIDRGEKLELKRRRGCVFIETDGGYEAHLDL